MFWRPLLLIAPLLGVGFTAYANSHTEICTGALLDAPAPAREWDANNLLRDPLFRPPNERGLVTSEAAFDVPTVLRAYLLGIYPVRENGNGKADYYSPPLRGITLLNPAAVKSLPEFTHVYDADERRVELNQIPDDPDAMIPRSDRKLIRRMLASGRYTVTFNRAFEEVMKNCRNMPRFDEDMFGKMVPAKGWITPRFIELYTQLHRLPESRANSVEVWLDGELVAGLYGVFIAGVFTGESMFYLKDANHPETGTFGPGSNAAKLAYYMLRKRLREAGHLFIDTEQTLGLVKKWGGVKLPRRQFQELHAHQSAMGLEFPDLHESQTR